MALEKNSSLFKRQLDSSGKDIMPYRIYKDLQWTTCPNNGIAWVTAAGYCAIQHEALKKVCAKPTYLQSSIWWNNILSLFFFTNNAAFRRTLGIFRIHPQRQNTLLKEKDLCWFTLKNVLQEGQSQMPGGGDRQVRREERCAVLKTVYSEMWKQTSVSIPGIIAPYVVTSG